MNSVAKCAERSVWSEKGGHCEMTEEVVSPLDYFLLYLLSGYSDVKSWPFHHAVLAFQTAYHKLTLL